MVRVLSSETRAIRERLVTKNLVLDSFMPYGEASDMANFLSWLLAGKSDHYTTSSSDIAGVATCLSALGYTILSACGLEGREIETPCMLRYSSVSFLHSQNSQFDDGYRRLQRGQSSILSPKQLDETLTLFPIDYTTANSCRAAWRLGYKASEYVKVELFIPDREGVRNGSDLPYRIVDEGGEVGRVGTSTFNIVDAHALVVNQQICDAFDSIFDKESDSTQQWL